MMFAYCLCAVVRAESLPVNVGRAYQHKSINQCLCESCNTDGSVSGRSHKGMNVELSYFCPEKDTSARERTGAVTSQYYDDVKYL